MPRLLRRRSYAARESNRVSAGLLGGRAAIGSGGNLGGRTVLARARERWSELLAVSVRAAQGLYGALADRLVWDGKEKVYGSIP